MRLDNNILKHSLVIGTDAIELNQNFHDSDSPSPPITGVPPASTAHDTDKAHCFNDSLRGAYTFTFSVFMRYLLIILEKYLQPYTQALSSCISFDIEKHALLSSSSHMNKHLPLGSSYPLPNISNLKPPLTNPAL